MTGIAYAGGADIVFHVCAQMTGGAYGRDHRRLQGESPDD
jgi:hypothetical protein